MKKDNWQFHRWCDSVCAYIYYPPDRESIKQELMWHLEDTAEGLEEQGFSRAEAETKAIEAMGDPKELGLLLRHVHKPWLTIACWAVVVLTVVLALVLLGNIFGDHLWGVGQEVKHLFRPEVNYENYYEYYSYNKVFDEDGNMTKVVEYPPLGAEIEPGGKASSGIYTFQVTDGWIIENENDSYNLVLVLSFSSPRFWTGPPVLDFLRVETSTGRTGGLSSGGNIYYHWPSISNTACGEYVLTLRDIEPDTKWLDIIYDRGEGFDLRVYLPEGGDWA